MVTIRRCTKEDEKAVLELITNVMSKEFQDAASAYPMEDVEQIATAYGGIGDAFFVAVDDHNKVSGDGRGQKGGRTTRCSDACLLPQRIAI